MLNRGRLSSKKISKTQSVQSELKTALAEDNIHIGPSDYIPWLRDNKIRHIHGRQGLWWCAVNFDVKLSVEDAPNRAVMIDAIRCMKLALDRNIGGNLNAISAFR